MSPATKKIAAVNISRNQAAVNRDVSSAMVLRQFRIVLNSVKSHFRRVEKVVGIGGAQLWALSVIRTNPGIGMNDLALALDVHQSTASNLVKSLVKLRLVKAAKTETDRRAVALNISPKGINVLDMAPPPFSGVLPDALAGLDNKTLSRLEKDLGKLILALNADEEAANIPLADL
jgi:DNA-binding MarR family transcriptional regulator